MGLALCYRGYVLPSSTHYPLWWRFFFGPAYALDHGRIGHRVHDHSRSKPRPLRRWGIRTPAASGDLPGTHGTPPRSRSALRAPTEPLPVGATGVKDIPHLC